MKKTRSKKSRDTVPLSKNHFMSVNSNTTASEQNKKNNSVSELNLLSPVSFTLLINLYIQRTSRIGYYRVFRGIGETDL
jgi:hypothetical protein